MLTLSNAKIGKTYRVVRITGEGALRRRIMDLGLTRGAQVYVRKAAPLGDPIEIMVRGYQLTLRKADAEIIVISDE